MADLKSVRDSIDKLREENRAQLTATEENTFLTSEGVRTLNKTVGDLVDEIRGNRLDQEEERRERRSAESAKEGGAGASPVEGTSNLDFMFLGGAMGILGAIGATIKGIVAGFSGLLIGAVAGVVNAAKFVLSPIAKLGDLLLKPVRGLVNALNRGVMRELTLFKNGFLNAFDTVGGVLSRIRTAGFRFLGLGVDGKPVVNTSNFVKKIYGAGKSLGDAIRGMTSYFGRVGEGSSSLLNIVRRMPGLSVFIDDMSKVFGVIKNLTMSGINKVVDFVQGITRSTRSFASTFGKIFSVFKVLGRVVAFPLTVIMGIIDAISGFNSEYERTGGNLLAGLLGGLGGVLSGIVGMPLDLLKSAVSWIAGKLGFEQLEGFLDSFSFAEGIKAVFRNLFDGINAWWENFSIDNMITSLKERFFSLISLPFKSIMSVFEPIKQIFTGEKSFLEGIYEALRNSVTTLLFLPYDMVKSAISGIFAMFGMDSISEALDSFSFQDTAGKLIDFFVQLPGKLVDGVMSILTAEDPFAQISAMASDFMAGLRAFIKERLPDPNESLFKRGLSVLIPDSVYEWAGAEAPKVTATQGQDTPEGTQNAEAPEQEQTQVASTPKVEIPEITEREASSIRMAQVQRENAESKTAPSVNAIDAKNIDASTRVNNNTNNSFMSPNISPIDSLDRYAGPA